MAPLRDQQPARTDLKQVEDLARAHRPALIRFFRRKGFSQADAEDGVQDVLFRLVRRADLLDDVSSVEGYLFTAAAHVATDAARKGKRQRSFYHHEFSDSLHSGFDHSAEEIAEGKEALDLLLVAMDELPERTRAVFVLVRFEHMNQSEIAQRLGIALSTVEKHLAKAISHLGQRAGRAATP